MNRRVYLHIALGTVAFVACEAPASPSAPDGAREATVDAGDGTPSGDASPAADAHDALDVAPDLPALPAYTCRPCLYDRECGEGGRCIPFDTNLPGARTCVVACEHEGSPCEAPVPATCRRNASASNQLVCTPTTSCVPSNARRAMPCPAKGCVGRYNVCVDLDRTPGTNGRTGTVCLPPCERDSDCEDGLRRCVVARTPEGSLVRACIPDERFGPDACGLRAVNDLHIGRGCDPTNPCPAPLACAANVDPALRAFCTKPCTRDGECGANARCLPLGTLSNRCVPDDCVCAAGARDTLLDRALAQGDPHWSRCNLFFTQSNLDAFPPNVSRDRYRLPVFDRVHRDWLHGARWASEMGPALDGRPITLSAHLAALASLRSDGSLTRVRVPPVSTDDGAESFIDTLEALYAYGGGAFERERVESAVRSIPSPLVAALTRILAAALDAARARDQGLRFATDSKDREHLFHIAPHLVLPTLRADFRPDFTQALDLGSLLGDVELPIAASLRLAATIESIDWRTLRGRMGPTLTLDTPLGFILVRDAAGHRYTRSEFERTLLVVDLGGNDTYENSIAANLDVANSVSVAVDLGGDDTYGYPPVASPLDTPELLPSDGDGRVRAGRGAISVSEQPRQAGARLGVALLYDLGGSSDRYRSLRMSQGFAAYGVGGLYDDGGDDEYTLEAGGQGAAIAGIAALVDAGGRDRYSAWSYAQGFAYVQGVAVLYDREGDDLYEGKVTPPLYGSAQDPTVNSSFVQGAGFGRRGDAFPDRINMSGGIGVLRDRAGDDRYTASIFGVGTGYWGGMGLLLDGAGNDHYDARWYTQGGAAHFAYAALIDGGGRDIHNMNATRQNMTAGAGHDFSLGIFVARGNEDDTYLTPNLALGAGNANGAGLFVDEGGADRYVPATALTLGNAALETLTDMGRLMRPTVGIFLDSGGIDRYERAMPGSEGNDRLWIQRVHREAPSERGFGADAMDARAGVLDGP